MKKIALLSIATLLILVSCKTGNQFTSRRYMKGHYASKTYHKDKINPVSQSSEPNSVLASKSSKTTGSIKHKPLELTRSNTDKKTLLPVSNKKAVVNTIKNAIKVSYKKAETGSILFKPLLLTKKTQNSVVTAKSNTKENSGSFDVLSLLAMIFGILGIMMSYIGFMIFAGTWTFAVFFVLALAFGVVGIIFGATGIKRYKDNGHWSSLAFGIAGLATGVISIIFGIIYFISNLILILAAA